MTRAMGSRFWFFFIIGEVLTTEQRSRLLEIANKCPVHRTLTSEIDIRTREI